MLRSSQIDQTLADETARLGDAVAGTNVSIRAGHHLQAALALRECWGAIEGSATSRANAGFPTVPPRQFSPACRSV